MNYDIYGYNKLKQSKSKKVSELFLGTISVQWKFLRVGYIATCTEALPMTFLEKMVCGIASLDGKVCLQDLARIMGFNIENDPQNLKFQDKGETEILMKTVESLKDYGVITSPDESFSIVELTDIGKEYYAQGRKFRVGGRKGFTMYFDLMSNEHGRAKSLFQKISIDDGFDYVLGDGVPFTNEAFVKQYAESQVPQIYSPELGNSFTDLSVTSKETLFKDVTFGVFYDTITEKYHFDVIDDGGIDAKYLNECINTENHVELYMNQFIEKQEQVTKSKSDSQLQFEDQLIQIQRDAEYEIYNKRPEVAMKLVDEFSKYPSYMEKENLFNYIKARLKTDMIKSLYISLPYLTDEIETEIHTISENNETEILLSCGGLNDFDTRFGKNVLVLSGQQDINPFIVMDDVSYHCENLVFTKDESSFSVTFLRRQEKNSALELEKAKEYFAQVFIPHELDLYESILNDETTDDIVEKINMLNQTEDCIHFTDAHMELTGNEERLTELRQLRDNKLIDLISQYANLLLEELQMIQANTIFEDINSIKAIDKIKDDFSSFKKKLIPELSKDNRNKYRQTECAQKLWEGINAFESQIDAKDAYLRQELLPKSYIIDTNVFMYCPQIMKYISKTDTIVLPAKVLDELDGLKGRTKGKEKKNVREAIREINHKILMKTENLRLVKADIKLLPVDFEKNNPDNLILSVALKLLDQNPHIITNDQNFQNKAATLGIPFMSLIDILPEEVYKTIDFSKHNTNIVNPDNENNRVTPYKNETKKTIVKEKKMSKALFDILNIGVMSCLEKRDEVLLAELATEIKRNIPSFNMELFGFSKFKDLCAAYPSVIELYKNEKGALCMRLIGEP